jgi:hypothetical protein
MLTSTYQITINVGDYGTVDPETGDWMCSGNIFQEEFLEEKPKKIIDPPGGLGTYVTETVKSFTVGADIAT